MCIYLKFAEINNYNNNWDLLLKKKGYISIFLNLQTSEGTVCNVCISSFTLYQHFRSKTVILGKYSLFHQSCMLSFFFSSDWASHS